NEFDNRLKSLMGKTLQDEQFIELISLKDNDFKKRIKDQFNNSRKERTKILGEKRSKEIEKRILLQSIDINWKSHIQYLEQLRQVIGLRSYGQRDPLIEYKKEAFDLFSNLLEKLKLDYITVLMNLKVIKQPRQENYENNENEILNNPKCLLILKKDQKISRNDRCEATGKKFKQCCGAL
ncbi:preprotein translocase subunit SecA, partial [Candidatus Pelagibacter sp.]|nr:preprotein translocase subunit SecA [Candidatus Pelagibacter sp.]